MDQAIVLALLVAMVFTIINFFRYVFSGQLKDAATMLVVWAAGVAVAFVASQSDLGAFSLDSLLGTDGLTLGNVNSYTLVLVGFALGSAASTGSDVIGAIDNNRTTEKPKLFP